MKAFAGMLKQSYNSAYYILSHIFQTCCHFESLVYVAFNPQKKKKNLLSRAQILSKFRSRQSLLRWRQHTYRMQRQENSNHKPSILCSRLRSVLQISDGDPQENATNWRRRSLIQSMKIKRKVRVSYYIWKHRSSLINIK
jgi:hypothetical protein